MTSAPEATEPTTVTSPSGKMIDWPERTGLSRSSEAGVGFAGGPAGAAGGADFLSPARAGSSISPALRPPLIGGGRPRPSSDGSAPSMPMMRMSRSCRSATSMASSPLSCGSAATSSTTGRPAKKPGERAHQSVELGEPLGERRLRREHERHEGAATEPDRAGAGGVSRVG